MGGKLSVPMIGKVIGNYQVTGKLAQGGMGAVYRGRHVTLPREVVIKAILLSDFSSTAQRQLKTRFLREAYIQSQLDHPNIVRVYEFFATEENHYLVMEYVAGMSVHDLLERQGALKAGQAVRLFKQALAALDYAHNFSYVNEAGQPHTGIIHRDLKPANMLLDGRAHLKLTDFGIVKIGGERGLTQSGFNPGTVAYMSPEQLRGLELDARSDLYSLGVTFYQMLAGRLPFLASSTGSDYDIRKGHIELEPPPLTSLRAEIPEQLAALVMRSLKKDPAERFQTAAEFLEAILSYKESASDGGAALPLPVNQEKPAGVTPMLADPLATQVSAAASTQPAASPAPEAGTVPPNRPRVIIPAHPVSTLGAAPPPRKRGLLALGIAAALLSATALGAYLITRQGGAVTSETQTSLAPNQTPSASPQDTAAPASSPAASPASGGDQLPAPSPSAARNAASAAATNLAPAVKPTVIATPESQPTPATDDTSAGRGMLNRARAYEQQERYNQAVTLYKEYLQSYPGAADAKEVAEHLAQLKQFEQLLGGAEMAMRRQNYRQAHQRYKMALELKPESRRAQAGLKEVMRLAPPGIRPPEELQPVPPGPRGQMRPPFPRPTRKP
jgi:serine/threonine protein kinase